ADGAVVGAGQLTDDPMDEIRPDLLLSQQAFLEFSPAMRVCDTEYGVETGKRPHLLGTVRHRDVYFDVLLTLWRIGRIHRPVLIEPERDGGPVSQRRHGSGDRGGGKVASHTAAENDDDHRAGRDLTDARVVSCPDLASGAPPDGGHAAPLLWMCVWA